MDQVYNLLGFEEPFSSWSHFFGAAYFAICSAFLIYRARGNTLRVTAVSVFCFAVVFLLSMSGTFHLLSIGGTARSVLQRLDHAGIWLLIISTFVPVHMILFKRAWRWLVLLIVWTIGITALVLKTVFFRDFPEYLSLTFYLVLGWFGLFSAIGYYRHRYPLKDVLWIVLGGLSYSLGAVFDFMRWPVLYTHVVQAHELFHLFVLGGIFCHWHFVYDIADMGVSSQLVFRITRRKGQPSFARALSENIQFYFSTPEEFQEKLRTHINQVFRPQRRPESICLRYVDEDFINPITFEIDQPADLCASSWGGSPAKISSNSSSSL